VGDVSLRFPRHTKPSTSVFNMTVNLRILFHSVDKTLMIKEIFFYITATCFGFHTNTSSS
jgi:hypothetical protein